MTNDNFFKRYMLNISTIVNKVDINQFAECVNMIRSVKDRKGKLIIVGNGGSAAISSHVSVDFIKAAGIRAINFNEADLITCFANDYGYENWVKEAIEVYGDSEDLVVLISSSGSSKNIINAASFAIEKRLNLITLSGFSSDNQLRKMGQVNFWVDSSSYNMIEMAHHIWLLSLVDFFANEISRNSLESLGGKNGCI